MNHMRLPCLFLALLFAAAGSQHAAAQEDYAATMKKAALHRNAGRLTEADAIYSGILEANHRNVDALVGRGLTRLRMGTRLEDALADFQKVLVLSPSYIDAYAGAATCLKRLGRNDEAASLIGNARKELSSDPEGLQDLADALWAMGSPDFARTLSAAYKDKLTPGEQYVKALSEARDFRASGRIEDAKKIYGGMLSSNPNNPDAHTGLGFCKMREEGRLEDALAHFRRVIELSPTYASAYAGAATCLKRLGRNDEAASLVENAKAVLKNDGQAIQRLADALWTMGNQEFARMISDTYKNTLSPREHHLEMLKRGRELRAQGLLDDAMGVYRGLLAKNPGDLDAMVGLGFCELRKADQVEMALSHFRKVIELSPAYTDAYAGAVTCLRKLEREEEAARLVTQAKGALGNDPDKVQKLAEALWATGNTELARSISEIHKARLSDREIYLNTLLEARELRLDGFTEDAEKIYFRLLDANPDDVDAIAGLGFCKVRDNEQLDEALRYFERVIKISPTYVDAYIGAAICHKRKEDRDTARAMLDQCRTACANDSDKLRYLAITAWREGYFPLARELDEDVPPHSDRVLIDDPTTLRLTFARSWLETQEDWDEVRLSISHRIRPDISFEVEYDRWQRYGRNDFNLGWGVSYRHDNSLALKYAYEMSDNEGFLAEQRHSATLEYRLYRRLSVYAGPRLARYSGSWSTRGKIGLHSYWKNFYAEAHFSEGTDTKKQDVQSHGVSLGYNYELRYALSCGYSRGDETVDFIRSSDIFFETYDIENFFVRVAFNPADRLGFSLTGMEEYRNEELFRRELAASVAYRF